MRNECFFCKNCEMFFDFPKYYYENHGLDTPPYERIFICPMCEGEDFLSFNIMVEKTEIVEKMLLAVMYLNRHINKVQKTFGIEIKNSDLSDSVEIIAELIGELFDFVDSDMQRKILNLSNEKELQMALTYLRGGL